MLPRCGEGRSEQALWRGSAAKENERDSECDGGRGVIPASAVRAPGQRGAFPPLPPPPLGATLNYLRSCCPGHPVLQCLAPPCPASKQKLPVPPAHCWPHPGLPIPGVLLWDQESPPPHTLRVTSLTSMGSSRGGKEPSRWALWFRPSIWLWLVGITCSSLRWTLCVLEQTVPDCWSLSFLACKLKVLIYFP